MQQSNLSKRASLEKTYNNSRINLLLVAAFTAVNVILLVTQSDLYFLFSAYIPRFIADMGMVLGGMYSPEMVDSSEIVILGTGFFAFCLVLAIIGIALYLISWIFSNKNRFGWMIFALVIFSLDTAAMLLIGGIALDSVIDVAFHIWVLVSLSLGIKAGSQLKKLPAEENVLSDVQNVEGAGTNIESSRPADLAVKARILLETNALGYAITYRRVKSVNELVVNGRVYDEFEAIIEPKHTLSANIDGHLIEAGFDGVMSSFIKIDGEQVAKKTRLV